MSELILCAMRLSNTVKFLNFCTSEKMAVIYLILNQNRTNGPINAHLTIAQVMPRYNQNNEKQEALL